MPVGTGGAFTVRIVPDENPILARRITGEITGEAANAWLNPAPGDHPAYRPNRPVTEYVTGQDEVFVRLWVRGANNEPRRWMVKEHAIRGLTPEQLQAKFQLPSVPDMRSTVVVPKGARMEYGTVNSGFPGVQQWNGHDIRQYRVVDDVQKDWFFDSSSF